MATLHIPAVPSLLAYCFCGYAALLVVWTIWKRKRPKHAEKWMRFLLKIRKAKDKVERGWAPATLVIFIATMLAIFTMGAKQYNDAPIVEKHNVRVIQKVGENAWSMSDDQGPFLYTACNDFPNETVIWAGYVAKKARWQEFGKCKSIRRSDLGFWWLRDKDFNAERIN